MKVIKKIINTLCYTYPLALILCVLLSNVYGQRVEISDEDFNKPLKKAEEKMKEIAYRVSVKITAWKTDSTMKQNTNFTIEFLPPNISRYFGREICESRVKDFEWIVIGDIHYYKNELGNWAKKKHFGSVPPLPPNIKRSGNYFYLGKEKIQNQSADVYEIENRWETEVEDEKRIQVGSEKYWFAENGFLLKKQMQRELLNPQLFLYKQIETFDYNPKNLKIEVPIK